VNDKVSEKKALLYTKFSARLAYELLKFANFKEIPTFFCFHITYMLS